MPRDDAEGHVLEMIRDYDADVQRLWRAVTDPVHLVQWFGPEGTFIDTCAMDLRQTGAWSCDLRGKESLDLFKVSGVVTSVTAPESGGAGEVSFTWAWHDASGTRGEESFVTFRVEPTTRGARLVLRHVRLTDLDAAQGHAAGWTSSLRKLDRFFGVSN